MKKVTLTDMNGKEIEVFFANNESAESMVHNDNYNVKIEDMSTNKSWAEFTGGEYNDPDHPLNKHDEGQMYNMTKELNELDVNENSAGGGAHADNLYEKLNKNFLNKVKCLKQSESQISIDDTIPSDFVELGDLRNGAIYKVAGLSLVAKLVGEVAPYEGGFHKDCLLKMKSHGTVFYVEEGALMKATELQVQSYLEESK
jgi:hypothetical protein